MIKTFRAVLMLGLAAGLVPLVHAQENPAAPAAQTSQKVASEPYQWKGVAIIGGGFVSGIITNPAQKGVIYARTDVGGAYRFDPAAKRWIPITDWVPASEWTYTGIESIAVDPTDPNVVYLAAGTYTNNWAPQNGAIFRSNDQGKTWKKSLLSFKNGGNENGRNIGERLMVDPNQPTTLYFGSRNNGLWKSADSGDTWQQVTTFPVTSKTNGIGIGYVQFDPASGTKGTPSKTIYVGVAAPGEANLYRSTDAGATWAPVPNQPKGLLPHHIARDQDGTLYLTYSDQPGPNGCSNGALYKLDPKTDTWTEISPVKVSDQDKFGYAGVSVDAQKPGTLVVSSLDRWAKGDDIWRSTDAGETWVSVRQNNERDASLAPHYGGKDGKDFGHWMGDVEIDPFDSGHAMYVTGMGIWATDNLTANDRAGQGGKSTWYPGALGIEECVVNDLASPPAGAPLVSVMWDIAGFRHVDLDRSPEARSFGGGRDVSIDFAELKPDVMVRLHGTRNDGKANGGAYSLDNGISWKEFAAAPGHDGTVAISADGATFVVTPEGGATKLTKDNGTTWTNSTGLPEKTRVVSDRVNPARFYALANGQAFASTDGGALRLLISAHKYYPTLAQGAAWSVKMGINQFLDRHTEATQEAIAKDFLTEADIDASLRGNFRVMIKLGILDPEDMVPYRKIGTGPEPWTTDKHKQLAREVTRKSIVLLKNRGNLLPLDRKTTRSIAVVGLYADRVFLDWYSGTPPYTVSPLEGIRAKAGPDISVSYAPDNTNEAAVEFAKSADVAIVIVGNHPTCNAGWAKTLLPSDGKEAVDRKSITLEHEELVKQVAKANPKTIVVLVSSFPYAINWTQQNVPAIVHMTHNSQETGNALADVLFGDYNPAGRLAQTWPKSMDQLPELMQYNIRNGRTYMYFKGEPLYPFGFGLSYTTFGYSNLKLGSKKLKAGAGGTMTLKVDITNTGQRDGEEVVQVYAKYLASSVERPNRQLVAFKRIPIRKGQTKTVQLKFAASQLAYWDNAKKTFVVEPGRLQLLVGASSADIRQTAEADIG